MSIKNAWLGLVGKLPMETVIETVKVEYKQIDLSELVARDCGRVLYGYHRATGEMKQSINPYGIDGVPMEYMRDAFYRWEKDHEKMVPVTELVYAMTCEQAHRESAEKFVCSVKAVKIGEDYYRFEKLEKVTLAEKPRIASADPA